MTYIVKESTELSSGAGVGGRGGERRRERQSGDKESNELHGEQQVLVIEKAEDGVNDWISLSRWLPCSCVRRSS